jgi:hypothetical protein
MQQPEGFDDGSGRVCRLKRSLYGLKQAPRCWNNRFKDFIFKLDFKQSEADPCVFIRCRQNEKTIVALHVDDGLIASTSSDEADRFMNELKAEFKIVSKEATYFLGLQIERLQEGSIRVSQEGYTKKILEKFQMSNCRPTSTPASKETGKENPVKNKDDSKGDQFSYRSAVGALLYLSTGSRPDIAYAVGIASRNLDNPSPEDFVKVKRIFRYLSGTANKGLVYRPEFKSGIIESYSDADHGGDLESGRSTTGVVCLYAGGAISWLSQKQTSVAISTTEAEIVAASEGAREIVWIKRLLNSMTAIDHIPELQVDNEAAIKLSKNPELHRRTKHIRIRHFYVREQVIEGLLEIKKVSTEFQLADVFTKALHKPRFQLLIKELGLG